MSLPHELTRHVRHIDILSAAVDAARGGEGRSMFTDQCDLHVDVPGGYLLARWAGAASVKRVQHSLCHRGRKLHFRLFVAIPKQFSCDRCEAVAVALFTQRFVEDG